MVSMVCVVKCVCLQVPLRQETLDVPDASCAHGIHGLLPSEQLPEAGGCRLRPGFLISGTIVVSAHVLMPWSSWVWSFTALFLLINPSPSSIVRNVTCLPETWLPCPIPNFHTLQHTKCSCPVTLTERWKHLPPNVIPSINEGILPGNFRN